MTDYDMLLLVGSTTMHQLAHHALLVAVEQVHMRIDCQARFSVQGKSRTGQWANHLSQEAGAIVLDFIVAKVKLEQPFIAVLFQGPTDLGGSGIAQLIAPEVDRSQVGVEHEQVRQGASSLLCPHFAPTQPQLFHLQALLRRAKSSAQRRFISYAMMPSGLKMAAKGNAALLGACETLQDTFICSLAALHIQPSRLVLCIALTAANISRNGQCDTACLQS